MNEIKQLKFEIADVIFSREKLKKEITELNNQQNRLEHLEKIIKDADCSSKELAVWRDSMIQHGFTREEAMKIIYIHMRGCCKGGQKKRNQLK